MTTLSAIREHLATLTDDNSHSEIRDHIMDSLSSIVAKQDFNSASKWIATAGFSPVELENFAGSLSYSLLKNSEKGLWIDWMGKTLPPNKAEDQIRKMVTNWTQNDYQAAGKWLTTAPEGSTKNTAIRSYAETVSQFEPQTAAQWALTLPPGKERNQTLKSIYNNWPKDDSAAKETFKQEHGIK